MIRASLLLLTLSIALAAQAVGNTRLRELSAADCEMALGVVDACSELKPDCFDADPSLLNSTSRSHWVHVSEKRGFNEAGFQKMCNMSCQGKLAGLEPDQVEALVCKTSRKR